jgi:hypothetical protein
MGGLYNILNGVNPETPDLLGAIGMTTDDFYRFRDVYLDGDTICVYTRGGGGNRECYCDKPHDEHCVEPKQERLREHPLYIDDFDDDFDCTYATFRFKTRGDVAEIPERQESKWPGILNALTASLNKS